MVGEAVVRSDPPLVVGDIETFLRQLVAALPPDPTEPRPGRPPILPALAPWGGPLVWVVHRFNRFTALRRLLSERGPWDYPRLADGGLAPLDHLFGQVRDLLTDRLAPFANDVVALDGTTFDAVARR